MEANILGLLGLLLACARVAGWTGDTFAAILMGGVLGYAIARVVDVVATYR